MGGHLLVVGAAGLVGRNVTRHFESLGDWHITVLGRRAPEPAGRTVFHAVDLEDPASLARVQPALDRVTHAVYCANYEKPNLVSGWLEPDHIERNAAMLKNTMAVLEPGAPGLRHITLMQGTKAYGAAAGAIKIPAKESDPRSLAPNFYYVQQDHLGALQVGKAWSWTILRPQWVCGFTVGGSMNGMAALGVYAAICRELGVPLAFPGGAANIVEATDVRLLAKAVHWAGTTAACANQIFNVVNGDVFDWHTLWPRIADALDMRSGHPAEMRLATVMADKAPVWDAAVRRHGLRPYRLQELVPSWEFADKLFGYRTPPGPMLLSGIKARQFGFHECTDSEEMILDWLRTMRADRIIP
jgi:nucleoside-diphosphate-sugar epimerase